MSKSLSIPLHVEQTSLNQKELGAYYTPQSLTKILCNWSIRSSNEQVLEPSFGGCGFLQSAIDKLTDLGSTQPHIQLYGCDIDTKAFKYLSKKLNAIEAINKRFLYKDFLTVSPNDFLVSSFDAIIGNPPYISRHNLSKEQLNSVIEWRNNNPALQVSKRASLWAYFLLHSIDFLNEGGRMAWVLPNSLLHADYGKQLQEILISKFGHVSIYSYGERSFVDEGTEERTLILTCDNYGQTTKQIDKHFCETLHDLNKHLSHATPNRNNKLTTKKNAYETLSNHPDSVSLGTLASILIGTVTGANNFFILSPSDVEKLKIEAEFLNPILAKFSYINGLAISKGDLSDWNKKNHRCLILHLDSESEASESIKEYTSTFDSIIKANNKTFQKRHCWLASDDKRIPDAFLSYMHHHGPRLVLNHAKINSTNSIHRVFFKENVSTIEQKLAAISMFTTFSQLSAEIVGRSYGSGVLKLEPSEAKKIQLLMPRSLSNIEIVKTFNTLNRLYRRGKVGDVERLANSFILGEIKFIETLKSDLKKIRKKRIRHPIN